MTHSAQSPYCHVTTKIGFTTTVDATRWQNHAPFHVPGVGGKRRFAEGEGANPFQKRYGSEDPKSIHAINAEPASLPPNRLRASRIVRKADDVACPETAADRTYVKSTPGPSQHPLLSLSNRNYGLSSALVSNFKGLGVRSIYPWQSSCLLSKGVLRGTNLIYTAPTGGGKSLVADVVLLKRIVENPSQKALVVLPYVALVQEKTKYLRKLVHGVLKNSGSQEGGALSSAAFLIKEQTQSEIRVCAFHGSSRGKITWSDCDVAVCTIEKANFLVNTAIEEGKIDELGIVVLDELHMIDDEYRGYIMELMISKLLVLETRIQLVGMSATLPNPALLAEWTRARLHVADYSPIPIEEYLVYDNAVYLSSNSSKFLPAPSQAARLVGTPKPKRPMFTIEKSLTHELQDPVLNAVVALSVETANEGYGVLVFCGSRLGAQSVARTIGAAIPSQPLTPETLEARLDVLTSLQTLSGGFEATFIDTIPSGVAFHHAGLTVEEREIVAEAFDRGTVKVLVATCGLAAGLNLPARRVIMKGARMGRELVGPAMLRQMRGRAGRKGKDEVGETFLCCHKTDLEAIAELLEAELPPVVSSLGPGKRGIKRAVLEVIAIRLASTHDSLQDYARCCLLWQVEESRVVLQMLDEALADLLQDGLIEKDAFDAYQPTILGSAIVASNLTPEDGLFVHTDLRRALSSFVMDTELHIFYLFTPIPHTQAGTAITSEVSWPTFRNVLESLDEPSLRALQLIGVNPALVNRMVNSAINNLPESTAAEIRTARVYRRVYSAFALRDLCNEMPVHQISLKYELPRGSIQSLAQTCYGFAAGMVKFCQRMSQPYSAASSVGTLTRTTRTPGGHTVWNAQTVGFSMLATILEHMQNRLYASARADLLEMAQVTFVKGRMARLLYENGFKSVRALSEADPEKDIVPIMMMVQGWKLRQPVPSKDRDDSNEEATSYDARRQRLEQKLLKKAEILVASASFIWERDVMNAAELED